MMAKAKYLLLLAGMCLSVVAGAQYSNSWIKPGQQYFKIPVAQDGIYRLTYANLLAAGFPANSVDRRYIQIFHRGQEQSIYVKGQGTHLSANDFIEFYGQRNDGTLDSLLYKPSSLRPHKYYNLYSDTTAYFLTYNITQLAVGLRMDSVQFFNVNSLPAETFQLSERLRVIHEQYSQGNTTDGYFAATAFDQGEGWTGNPLQPNQSVDYVIDSLINGVTSATSPKLELLLVGRDVTHHDVQVYVGPNVASLRLLASSSFENFATYLVSSNVNWTDIGSDGKMVVRINALPVGTTNRFQASVSYVKVVFPQSFDWTNQKKKSIQLVTHPIGQSYLSFINPPANLRLWDISDPLNIVRVIPALPNTANFVVPGTSVPKKIFSASVFSNPQITPINFTSIDLSASFLIITNKALMKPAGSYSNPVQAYADYRASTAGGGYNTLIVTIDQLYNQFNYGETSPSAIYSFMKFMASGNSLKYLFLIGRGRDISYAVYSRQPVPPGEPPDLVPSAGYPGGDNAFTAGLNGASFEPAVPTGRLPATTPQHVAIYLDKIKEHESQPLQPWAKELLHLSGGGNSSTDAFEIALFKLFVDGFKTIAEGSYLGGHVTTKSKQDIGIEQVNISPAINSGVNLVTYYGHASSSQTEIDIGFVDDPNLNYQNDKKYPVFLFNGCDAGEIFQSTSFFTENWLLTAGKGSRNFIAGTSFGEASALQKYTTLFYQVGFGDSTFIKTGIGDIQKETSKRYIARYIDPSLPDVLNVAQVQQMILAGDPSIKLFGTNTADFAINNGSISLASLDNKPVTSLSDSFALKIIVKNLGAYNPKPLKIQVIRTFNNNSTKTYDSTLFSSVLYIDTVIFKLKKEKNIDGFGNNKFIVIIDPANSVKEINEENNIGTLSALIPSNGTINLYPTNFGIVNSTALNLVFQDADLLGSKRDFSIQVDTTRSFNSSFLIDRTISAKVFAKMSFSALSNDSTVYYWRTKPKKQSPTDSANWSTSSFVYIKNGTEGWAQKRFQQLSDDAFTNFSLDDSKGKIKFQETVSTVSVKSIGANSGTPIQNASMKIDGVEYNVTDLVPCRNNTINLVAFNKSNSVPYGGISYFFDSRGCGLQPPVINSYLLSEIDAGANNMLVSIDNIHANDSVVLYSIGNPNFSQWSSTTLTKLNDLGISNSQIAGLQDGEPIIILSKKGAAPGSAKIFRSPNSPATFQDLSINGTVTGRFSSGSIKSAAIGPAKNWVKFSSRSKGVESTDVINYSIYGVALDGRETLLQSNIGSNFDLSFIDAGQYPQLKVQVDLKDSVNLTAAQLRNWFVTFESVAEGLLIFQGSLTTQTVQEGQPFSARFGFTNISSKTFTDSLQVRAQTSVEGKGSSQINTFKIKAPAPGDTAKFSFDIDSKGKPGLNDVSVFVNPKIQPEQYYENNGIDLLGYLNVLTDKTHPSLEVTVDGRYLQNNDFVSANPWIQIKLQDENSFLPIGDTTHMTILLSYPCDNEPCAFKRISFSRPDLQWSPATSSSDFVVNFRPTNLPEGSYKLQISATDESDNASGTTPFSIDFRVKDATSFKLNAVSPNPSKDIFNFNFTLSGNELPSEFSLQVFSLSGKLISEFGINDVSGFVIGTNNLSWAPVASTFDNGLLIYRLHAVVDGKSFSESGKLSLLK